MPVNVRRTRRPEVILVPKPRKERAVLQTTGLDRFTDTVLDRFRSGQNPPSIAPSLGLPHGFVYQVLRDHLKQLETRPMLLRQPIERMAA